MAISSIKGSGQGLPMFQSKSPVFSNPDSVFRRGEGGILPERGSRAQLDMVTQLLGAGMQSAQSSGSPLLAFLAPMVGGAVGARTQGLYKDAQQGRDQAAVDQLLAAMGGGTTPATLSSRSNPVGGNSSLLQTMYPVGEEGPAPAGNIDPETGLDMGEKVRSATDVSMDMIRSFEGFRETPYWDVNAHRTGYGSDTITNPDGSVRRVTPSDRVTKDMAEADLQRRVSQEFMPAARNAVGAETFDKLPPHQQAALTSVTYNYGRLPDTVARAVQSGDPQAAAQAINALGAHNGGINAARRSKEAQAFLGAVASGDFETYAGLGQSPRMSQDNMRQLIGLMTNPDLSPEIRNLASTMLGGAMQNTGTMSPRDQIGLARDMLGLEQAMQPQPVEGPTYRAATPEEAAAYGATAGQIDTKTGRFYPASTGNSDNGMAATQRQQNEATTILSGAIEELVMQGLTRDEAMKQLARDPIYSPQFRILGIDPASFGRAGAPTPNAPAQPAPPTAETPSDPLGIR